MFDCPYNTLTNTIGVGDVISPGECGLGSGDKFTQVNKIAKKKASQGFNYSQPLPTVVYTNKK